MVELQTERGPHQLLGENGPSPTAFRSQDTARQLDTGGEPLNTVVCFGTSVFLSFQMWLLGGLSVQGTPKKLGVWGSTLLC